MPWYIDIEWLYSSLFISISWIFADKKNIKLQFDTILNISSLSHQKNGKNQQECWDGDRGSYNSKRTLIQFWEGMLKRQEKW